MLKRVTSNGVHLRDLAFDQHSFEETSRRWRAVDDIVSDLTGPGIDPQTFLPIAMFLTTTSKKL